MNVDLAYVHRQHSALHRDEILRSATCGCFYCLRVFDPQQIREWCDGAQTAICPYCGIDAVIGAASGYPITTRSLGAMRQRFF